MPAAAVRSGRGGIGLAWRGWAPPAGRSRGNGGRRRAERGYDDRVDALEIFFTTLLVLVSLVIVWFAGYVVYKLYKGQA